jgi:hypothetical protein
MQGSRIFNFQASTWKWLHLNILYDKWYFGISLAYCVCELLSLLLKQCTVIIGSSLQHTVYLIYHWHTWNCVFKTIKVAYDLKLKLSSLTSGTLHVKNDQRKSCLCQCMHSMLPFDHADCCSHLLLLAVKSSLKQAPLRSATQVTASTDRKRVSAVGVTQWSYFGGAEGVAHSRICLV